MVRDTRWMYPRSVPSPAAARAMADIAAALAAPPANRSSEEMLAELEARRIEDEARRSTQGVLRFGSGV